MPIEAGGASEGARAAEPVTKSAAAPATIFPQAVNGWRGPGSLAVAFGHFSVTTGLMSVADLAPLFLVVDLFFVLSGLLIAHAYTERLRRAAAIPEYIVRRFGRIWPVHAAMLALLVAFEILKGILHIRFGTQFASKPFDPEGVNSVPAIWTNLFLVHSIGLHKSGTWNYPSWSLSVEFVTYAAFAVFCLLRPSLRRTASVAIIVLSLAILAFVAPKHMRSTFDYGLFRCTAGFFAGALLYDVLRHVRLPTWPMPTVVECLASVLLVVWMYTCRDTILGFAAPIVICLFILAFIQGRGLLSRLLVAKPFQVMAELSFAIYMVHAVILLMLIAALHVFERASGVPLFATILEPQPIPEMAAKTLQVLDLPSRTIIAIMLGYFVSILLASYGVYRFVEIPGRAVFGSLAKRMVTPRPDRRSPAAPSPAIGRPARAETEPT